MTAPRSGGATVTYLHAIPIAGGAPRGTVFIKADQVTNTGTILATGKLTIDAGTFTNEQLVSGSGGLQTGGVVSGTDVVLITTGDFTDIGGRITASGDLSLTVGGDIRIAAQAVTTTTLAGGKGHWITTTTTTNTGALVSAGGTLTMHADGALAIAGSRPGQFGHIPPKLGTIWPKPPQALADNHRQAPLRRRDHHESQCLVPAQAGGLCP